LVKGFTEFRHLSMTPENHKGGWFPLPDDFLDGPILEDVRYEREGNLLKEYRLNIGSLHWYVCGKYELR
jgi:hypothetical protein